MYMVKILLLLVWPHPFLWVSQAKNGNMRSSGLTELKISRGTPVNHTNSLVQLPATPLPVVITGKKKKKKKKMEIWGHGYTSSSTTRAFLFYIMWLQSTKEKDPVCSDLCVNK